MPQAFVYHIQINVSDARRALPFYRDFLNYWGYQVVDEGLDHLGMSNGTTDFWVIGSKKEHSKRGFHRKAPGLNHIALGAASREAVEKFAKGFLKKWKVKTLYGSPRLFPEYYPGYYAVYFEGPDRVKWEVVHISHSRKKP